MGAVETEASKTSVFVSMGAGGGVFGGRSRPGERLSFRGAAEEGTAFLGDSAGAASGPGTKTQWLREQLASSTIQQARLHAK